MFFSRSRRCLACLAVLVLPLSVAAAEEKFVLLEPMQARYGISVNADGNRITLTGNDYLLFNEKGKQLKTVGIFHWGTSVIRLAPLPDGRAISCTRGLNPHVDMMRPTVPRWLRSFRQDGTTSRCTETRIGRARTTWPWISRQNAFSSSKRPIPTTRAVARRLIPNGCGWGCGILPASTWAISFAMTPRRRMPPGRTANASTW